MKIWYLSHKIIGIFPFKIKGVVEIMVLRLKTDSIPSGMKFFSGVSRGAAQAEILL